MDSHEFRAQRNEAVFHWDSIAGDHCLSLHSAPEEG
jgi:hypothetical protein